MPNNRCSNCIAYSFECTYVETAKVCGRSPPRFDIGAHVTTPLVVETWSSERVCLLPASFENVLIRGALMLQICRESRESSRENGKAPPEGRHPLRWLITYQRLLSLKGLPRRRFLTRAGQWPSRSGGLAERQHECPHCCACHQRCSHRFSQRK